ncbi:MAG: hypothetical protein HYV97_12395 [Bdellovibrio sp.]|nr:hypothetical protein [Bdellovibrio sp.]
MFLKGKRLVQFEAIQAILLPRFAVMDSDGINRSRNLLNNFLASKALSVLLKIALFLHIIDGISFFYGLHCFRHLPPHKQKAVMSFLFNSPIPLLRKGFWGINTLAKMGVYGQTELYADIGYKVKIQGAAK